MKHTPAVLAFLAIAANLLLAFVHWASRANTAESSKWLNMIVQDVQPRSYELIFGLTAFAVVVQFFEKLPRISGFKRSAVQHCLDQIVSGMCQGRARQNRLTLFRCVPGWYAWMVGHARLLLRPGNMQHKRAALSRINWAESYLYVYARSTDSRNSKSSAAFKVSDSRNSCEGFVGIVWEKGFHRVGDLPEFEEGELRGLRSLDGHPRKDEIEAYMKATNISSLEQVRAIEHFARHFIGAKVRVGEGEWGVLLLDSEQPVCPFNVKQQKGGSFGKEFENHTKVLARILK